MDYNTTRKKLVLPEYGRNIQKMVLHLKTVEDRDERNRLAQAIIHIMGNMNPHLRDVNDFKHKLWDHLAIISDFELDVDSPYPAPLLEKLNQAPDKLPYKNKREVKYMHYGRVLGAMAKRVVDYPAGEEKDYLIEVVCNHMKKSFLNWNRESVSDDLIFSDFKNLTGHQVEIPAGLKLKEIKDLINKPPQEKSRNHSGGGSYSGGGRKDHRKKSGGHSKKRY